MTGPKRNFLIDTCINFHVRCRIQDKSRYFNSVSFFHHFSLCVCVSNYMNKQKFSSFVLHSKRWRHLHNHKMFIGFVWKEPWPVCRVHSAHSTYTNIQICRFEEFHLCVMPRSINANFHVDEEISMKKCSTLKPQCKWRPNHVMEHWLFEWHLI